MLVQGSYVKDGTALYWEARNGKVKCCLVKIYHPFVNICNQFNTCLASFFMHNDQYALKNPTLVIPPWLFLVWAEV